MIQSMSPPAAPRLFLIRHGETAWTLTGQHTGLTDIPLTPAGESKAAVLGERLRVLRDGNGSFTRVFTSPLIRARRTCELAGFGEVATVDADLVEWNYGQYDGLTSAQINRDRPDWDLFRDGVPGGESPEQAAARADRFLERVRMLEGDVAAFSSGHFIRLLAARWLDLPTVAAKHFYTATASIGILGYEHGREDRAVLLWNQTR
jgi:broad specificity phosphatase PhoE